MIRLTLRLALDIVVVLAFVPPTQAAIPSSWNTNLNGSFTDATKWNNGVPMVNDTALFDRNLNISYGVTFPGRPILTPLTREVRQIKVGTNTVSFSDDVNLNQLPANLSVDASNTLGLDALIIGETAGQVAALYTTLNSFSTSGATIGKAADSTGTLNVSGAGSTLTITGSFFDPMVVGSSGTGTLNIMGGGHVNDESSSVAAGVGSTGIVVVDGVGSKWTNHQSLNVGRSGIGMLTISNSGQVVDKNATLGADNGGMGTVHVMGTGSIWTQSLDLRVGAYLGSVLGGGSLFGFGTLNITNTGRVNTNGDASIAALTSKAAVDGSGSAWTVGGQLSIEFDATLDIKAGGLVSSDSAFVGRSDNGTAIVNGAGSTWNISDILFVGQNGTGTLNVTGGGHLNSRVGFLGIRIANSTSSAIVHIDGSGSTWTSSEQLFIGYESEGLLLVTNGGQVTSSTGQLGLDTDAVGTVRVNGSGSKWTNTESLYVGVAGIGDLVVTNGGIVSVDGLLSIGPRGTVEGNNGSVSASVRNGGTVSPGLSSGLTLADALGTLQLDGDYKQAAAGTLEIQLASTASFDKLVVAGHATLAGTLKLSLLNGFMPVVGDMFQVLTATGGITGTMALDFSSLQTGTGGPAWIVNYSNSDVLLKLVNLPPGDYNRNGTVDAADYTVWRNTLGQTGTGLAADGNGNDQIDAGDFTVWKLHYGESAGGGSGANANAAIPEPASIGLALLGLMALACRRNRRRNSC